VFVRSNCAATLAALALAVALGSCARFDFDSSAWFSKPLNLFGNNLGYTYSQLDEAKTDRPLTANDFVSANGACPTPAAPAASSDAASLLGGGVAIGMSECDVVARLGQPTTVNIGQNPNGLRSAVLSYPSGPRPGVYRFEAGRLAEMDRLETPAPPPESAKKKTAKKKPADGKNSQKADGKT